MNNLLSLPPDVLGRMFTSAHPDVKMRNGSLRLFRDLYHFGQVSKLANDLFNIIIGSDYFKQVVHPSLSKAFSVDLKERTFWLKECIASSAWEGELSVTLKVVDSVDEQAAFETKEDSWVIFQIEKGRKSICRIECEGHKETLKLEDGLDAHAPYCDPYIAYSGGDWVAVQSGSLDNRQESSIRVYSWENKKEVKKLLLQMTPRQIQMEKDHLFILSTDKQEDVLQIYNLAQLSEEHETVSLPLDVKKFYISHSAVYLFCANTEGYFLKIIKKKGLELTSETFNLPRNCLSEHIVVNANELLMVTPEKEQLQFASVEWIEDKFVSKTLATCQNNGWGTLENWQFRAGHAFLQFRKFDWHCVIFDLEKPDIEPQIIPLEDPQKMAWMILLQSDRFRPQMVVTPFKCHHLFLHLVITEPNRYIFSKVLTIQPVIRTRVTDPSQTVSERL